MKKLLLLSAAAGIILSGCCSVQKDRETIFQYSTLGALAEGVYDGDITLEEAGGHGDFGIGTYNTLDGEMLLLDGVFYQMKSDGKIIAPSGKTKSPFLVATFFDTDKLILLNKKTDFDAAMKLTEKFLPSKNIFYAVRIKGNFSFIKTRSVAAQGKPYMKLGEVVKKQKVFETSGVKGTAAGFYFPEYSKGLNLPGFHMHFIDDGKTTGGHILDFTLESGTIEIDETSNLSLVLPSNGDFLIQDFRISRDAEIGAAEKK